MRRAFGYESFGGPEVQTWFDRPDPRPQAGEVLVAVRAAGVARIDVALRAGQVPALNGHVPFPHAMGVQGAGDVLATGAGVTDLRVGDPVFGFALTGAGTYAGTTVLPAENAARLPEGLSYADAATIPVAGTTALDALDGLDLPAGATVLVNGVGGSTGLVTAQLAAARGLTVIGTGSDAKRAVAEPLGVTFVSYQAGDVADQVRALVPGGVDGVVDLVGGDPLRSVAGLVEDPDRLLSVVSDGVVAGLGGREVVRRLGRSGLETVAALVVAGVLDAHITRSVPLDRAPEAVAAVESGHATGNTVITLPA